MIDRFASNAAVPTSRRWRRGHDSFDSCAGTDLVELRDGTRRGTVLLYVPLGLGFHCCSHGVWRGAASEGACVVAVARHCRGVVSQPRRLVDRPKGLQIVREMPYKATDLRACGFPSLRIAKPGNLIVSVRGGQSGRVGKLS